MLSNALKARFLATFLATSSGVVIFSTEASYGDTIRHVTGKCLDVASEDGSQNGSRIQLWDCNGAPAQQFTFTQGSIRHVTGKCLDVAGEDGGRNGSRIQLWDCNGVPAQQFTLTAGGAIRHVGGKCLDVASEGGGQNGSRIQLWDCNGTPAQRLAINSFVSFPITGNRDDTVANGRMGTSFTLTNGGRLTAVTNTRTGVRLAGFTGAVGIVLLDSNRQPIWASDTQSYGVDGCTIGRCNRNDNWSATVPADIMQRVRGYTIIHRHNPTWLSRVGARGDQFLRWLGSDEGQGTVGAIVAIAVML